MLDPGEEKSRGEKTPITFNQWGRKVTSTPT